MEEYIFKQCKIFQTLQDSLHPIFYKLKQQALEILQCISMQPSTARCANNWLISAWQVLIVLLM